MTETTGLPVHVRRTSFDLDPAVVRLRAERPVSRVRLPLGEAWLITRYDEVREVLRDAARFSNGGEPPVAGRSSGEGDAAGSLLAYDLRRVLTAEFTVRRMRRLRPQVERIVAGNLDLMETAEPPVDLMGLFGLPVASSVICELLGVPPEDREDFQRQSHRLLDPSIDLDLRSATGVRIDTYLATLVARLRQNPGGGLLGVLVRKHGSRLGDRELVGIGNLLLIAGQETTANMLGLGTLALLRHPDQLALMRDNDQAVEPAVEELLRFLSIVHSIQPRVATMDTVVGGQPIAAGDILVCSLPAANRDPNLGDGMDELDLTRPAVPHLAFGHGIHHCLGAPLARLAMRTAFPALLRRFPKLRLAMPFDQVRFHALFLVHGIKELPVTW
ncbi:cytochrome P450 [Fodinicola acaciae]|uniref:cytochrome P450 n=1 Tax=Fodinicola acaciae TaxID=2681555 RepID=UPI0013D3936A|nr:cytochrome P450 [Fodinicola acaciae]